MESLVVPCLLQAQKLIFCRIHRAQILHMVTRQNPLRYAILMSSFHRWVRGVILNVATLGHEIMLVSSFLIDKLKLSVLQLTLHRLNRV